MTEIAKHMRAVTKWGVTTSGGMTVDQIILAGADEIDRQAKVIEATEELLKQAKRTHFIGARVGPHWTFLGLAIQKTRAALAALQEVE